VRPTSRTRKVSAVKAEATRLHSLIVRSRGRCENCGDAWRATGSKLECAHIVSRRYSRTRTLVENAFCLCSKCHMRFTEWPLEFAAFVEEKIGAERYAELRTLAQSTAKVDWYDELDRLRAVAERLGVAA
jgi:5-methylcytosine-specific restriction endonuclease McrA